MAINIITDSATIGTSEYYLASDSTTKTSQTDDCILQAWIDFGAMQSGDQYEIKFYEKINTVERSVGLGVLSGAQASPFVTPSFIVGEGWEISVKKLAGTDRSIGWSLRKGT